MEKSHKAKFGIDIGQFLKLKGSLSKIHKCAVTIERLGFDSTWLPDHSIDPLTTLAYIAANTKRVKLGMCVLIPSHRNPVLLARRISTLDNLSGGRFILGLGAGEGIEKWGTRVEKPVSRMLETIEIMKKL